jgi:hypothetical protein
LQECPRKPSKLHKAEDPPMSPIHGLATSISTGSWTTEPQDPALAQAFANPLVLALDAEE